MTRPKTPEALEQLLRTAYERTSEMQAHARPPLSGPPEPSGGKHWNAPLAAAAAAVVAVAVIVGGRIMTDRPNQATTPATTGASVNTPAPSATSTQKWHVAGATVVGSGTSEAHLCVGPVTASVTPECSGPTVTPWDWAAVQFTQSGQAHWGIYDLTGTWDGTRLTLVEPPVPNTHPVDAAASDLPACPTPAGGWVSTDPGKAGDDDLAAAQAAAQRLSTFGAMWVRTPSDAKAPVLNIAVTQDTSGAQQQIRQMWGGPLCILPAKRTQAELARIETDLRSGSRRTEILESSTSLDRVSVTVFVDPSQALQSEVDQRFGPGIVHVESILKPAN